MSEGADPACWLHRVCPECGALFEDGADQCWRCAAPEVDAEAERDTDPDADPGTEPDVTAG